MVYNWYVRHWKEDERPSVRSSQQLQGFNSSFSVDLLLVTFLINHQHWWGFSLCSSFDIITTGSCSSSHVLGTHFRRVDRHHVVKLREIDLVPAVVLLVGQQRRKIVAPENLTRQVWCSYLSNQQNSLAWWNSSWSNITVSSVGQEKMSTCTSQVRWCPVAEE